MALVLSTTATGHAATLTWSGGSGGAGDAWRNGNNWTPAAGQGGPGTGDEAIFSTAGTAAAIGINFNDGRGQVVLVGSIALAAGGSRSFYNSSANSVGTLRLEGSGGRLLANSAPGTSLSLLDEPGRAMGVHLAAAGDIEVGPANASIIIGSGISGSSGFGKTGAGLLRLEGSNVLGGPVVVSGGVLELAGHTGASLGFASTVRVENGATLKLVRAEQLGASTALDLAGGTLRGATGQAAVAETAGALTLSANSTIDLGASSIRLANSSAVVWAAASVLTITNWRGPAGGNGGGRLFFGVGGLDSAQLAQIYFADAGILGAQLIGPDGELSPIPEAPVIAGAAALVVFILWRERGRLIRAARRRFVR